MSQNDDQKGQENGQEARKGARRERLISHQSARSSQDREENPFATTNGDQQRRPEVQSKVTVPSVNAKDEGRLQQPPTSQQEPRRRQQTTVFSRFLSIHLFGSIDCGRFESVNDVYVKYSIVTGPDWILSSGTDVGVTQIARFRLDGETNRRLFIWNQPIAVSYRSYNYYGWPQIVLSVYYFDGLGNDQILGYGCIHLPVSGQTPANFKQTVSIFAPQSSSFVRQLLSWITGKKPELVDSNLFARGDCRAVLQMVPVGKLDISFDLTTKDVANNGYKS